MKKNVTFLFTLLLAVVGVRAEVAAELVGKYFSAAEPATALQTDTWYLLRNQGRNAYISEEADAVRMKSTSAVAAVADADANAGILFKLANGGAEGQYSIVSGNGNYLTFGQSSSAMSASAVDYIIGKIADGVWYMQDPSSKVVADGNAAGGTFVGWGTSVPTGTNGNSAYQFLEVALFDEAAMTTLNKAAGMAYDLQVASGLVTDASKFSSNAKEPSEGSFGALIDGEYTSYFHSAYSVSVDGAHYLQAEVNEPVKDFFFYFKKRSHNNNNRPTDITVLGSNDGQEFKEIITINTGFPTDAADLDYASAVINASEAYKHFRFVVNNTNSGTVFFTFSEFYLLPADKVEALAAAQALVAAGPTAENFDELAAEFETICNKIQADKVAKLHEAAVAEAEAVLASVAYAPAPALGQYPTASYDTFKAIVEELKGEATQENVDAIKAALVAFEITKNLPLFTIDSQKDYALGQSIYENEEGALSFKTTDAADKSMLWAFDMTATEVGLTDKVVVRNAATGNLFWGASFISVIETEPAVEGDGVFMFKTEGTGSPVHAQQSGSSIVRWSSADANTVGGASTWKFAFVGVSNPAAYDLSEVAASFKEQAMAFAGLQNEAALSSLPKVQEMWAEGMGVVEPLFTAIEAGELVLKADVEAAMEMMSGIQAVVAFYAADFSGCLADAEEFLATLEEGSERYQAWDAAIAEAKVVNNVTTVKELEDKMAALEEAFANLPEDKDPNDYTSYIINADLATTDAWDASETKGIKDGMVKVGGNTFNFCQTITLPAGQYKMTAKAAYRYANSTKPEEQYEYDAIQAGKETHLAKLYAETSTYKYEANVQNRWEGASDTDYAAGSGSVTVNGKFVPNSSAAVQIWFNNGQYVNELIFNVQEEGEVKIGIAKTENCPDGDYTNIGAWTLTRLGDAEADPEETVDLDMTHLVGTSKEAWTGNNGGPVNIDGISMPEKYETTTATLGDVMWQTVEGLYNGTYTVELWANARFTSGRGFESKAKDGDENFTYLFANNVEKSIAVYHNGGLNSNKSYTLEGVEVTDGTLKMGMTKKGEGSNWHTIQIKSLTLHATNEVIANIAKVDLKAALDAANAVSPITDEFAAAIAAAQNVYDNSTDAEEVKAAITSLKEATKLAILMNATEENPVLTDFVVNGTFDAGTTGWKSTTGAANQGTATNQQGAFTGAFFENWNSSNYTGKLYQVIENIPNGVYELSICAFVETFDGSAQFVYANADKVALTTGVPTAYTVRTIVKNNTIEVGFEQTAAVNRWCGIDNVSLTYFGEASDEESLNAAKVAFTAAYEEFGAALTACQAMMLKMSFAEIDDAAYQLNEQLETTTDVDALNTMAETLAEATASLKEINEVYAGYDVFVQKFKAAAEISEPKTTEAAELLEFHMYGGAGMQAASLEALAQAVQTIKADYFTYIANANLLDGNKFDLTFMIQNPGFEMNLDGWTCVNAGHNGGAGYNNVGGIAEIALWGAESWEASISQTLNELPNGKYIVKAAWMAASGIEMTFSANEGEASVTGIGDTGGNIDNDGNVVEMGQGFRGWQYVEVEGEVVDGTLTITVNSSSTALHTWSNADAFELYYAGVPAPVEPEYLTVVGAKVGDVALVEGKATVESISTIDVIFDRPVAKAENAGWATLADSWGPTNLNVEVLEAEEGSSEYVVRFTVSDEFGGEFTAAGDYELNIPEGFIVGAEGANYISSEITATITIEAAPATPLTVTSVTVGEDVMEGFTVVATPADMIKVNFDAEFYFSGMPTIVNAEGNDASDYFTYISAMDAGLEGNSYILQAQNWEGTVAPAGVYTITLSKASFMNMMQWKAPAEDIVLTVEIIVTGIDNINADANAVIYDIHGRRVEKMEKGIYIVNGKKVIKK